MHLETAIARPCSDLTHVSNFMGPSLSPEYRLSISHGEFCFLPDGYLMRAMQTVFETRRIRLRMLVDTHGGVAALNRAIGWEETNARLYQINNGSIRSDRGTPYVMGDPTAREIEEKLFLPEGWMDTPPTYAEMHGSEDPRSQAIMVMESMSAQEAYQALAVLVALKKPTPAPEPGTPEAAAATEDRKRFEEALMRAEIKSADAAGDPTWPTHTEADLQRIARTVTAGHGTTTTVTKTRRASPRSGALPPATKHHQAP